MPYDPGLARLGRYPFRPNGLHLSEPVQACRAAIFAHCDTEVLAKIIAMLRDGAASPDISHCRFVGRRFATGKHFGAEDPDAVGGLDGKLAESESRVCRRSP